jgi:hypothetical protein
MKVSIPKSPESAIRADPSRRTSTTAGENLGIGDDRRSKLQYPKGEGIERGDNHRSPRGLVVSVVHEEADEKLK